MKINQNEDYIRAAHQLNTLQMHEARINSASSSKVEATEKSGESSLKNELSNKENHENVQGGLESEYLDRTQPERGNKAKGSGEAPDAESGNPKPAKPESKSAIARLDTSNVDAEIKRLREQLAKAQQQAQSGDESAKARTAQLEAEIKQKSSKEYKKAHGVKTVTLL